MSIVEDKSSALLYSAFETKNSFDKFSQRFGMKPYRFIDLKSAGQTLQSSHLTIPPPSTFFYSYASYSQVAWTLVLCKGIAEPRGTVCRDVVNYILCGISYSRAKIGHVSRSCLGEDLMLNLMRENAWNSVKQQVWEQWRTQEFCSGVGVGSTNSVEDRGQRERRSGGR